MIFRRRKDPFLDRSFFSEADFASMIVDLEAYRDGRIAINIVNRSFGSTFSQK